MKKYNDFEYTAFGKKQFKARQVLGYAGGNFSADGEYVIGDRGDSVRVPIAIPSPRPSYVTVEMAPNWPYLTHEEALKVTSIRATSANGSDGWGYSKEEN